MANKQIDALAAFTTPADSTDIIHAKQGGVDKKVTIDQLRSEVGSVGNFYSATGINALTLTAAGNTVGITEFSDGLELTFTAPATNTAGVTANPNALGGKIVEIDGVGLSGGEITLGDDVTLRYNTATSRFELVSYAGRERRSNSSAETIGGNKYFSGDNHHGGDNNFSGVNTFTNSGNTYNGIAQANLLDKTVNDTVSGSWNFTGSSNIYNGIAAANLADKSVTSVITGDWWFQARLTAYRTTDVDSGVRFQNSATGVGTTDGGYVYTEATTKNLKIRNYDGNVVIGNSFGTSYESYFDTTGGFVVGAPVGGSKGIGAINVSTGYYVNGTKLPTMYTGRAQSTLTSYVLPTGWTISQIATGVYRITHNLGLSNDQDLTITASILGSGASHITVNPWDVNSFQIHTYNSTGTSFNSSFYFIGMRNVG